MNERLQIITKLMAGYPSAMAQSRDTAKATLAAIIETTASFSTSILSDACRELAKRPGAFPPSAGEIYDKCADLAARQPKGRPLRIAYSRDEPTPEQRQANLQRLERIAADMRAGRIPPQRGGYSLAEMADFGAVINIPGSCDYVLRVDEAGVPLTIPNGFPGAGKRVAYGYLTPVEASQPVFRKAATRTVPGSFLEKWEREKGYEHICRVQILNSAKVVREAAE